MKRTESETRPEHPRAAVFLDRDGTIIEDRGDLRRSFVIGDHPHDVEFAARAGATGVYVLSGHGRKHREELTQPATVVEGIREAVDQILLLRR